MSWRATSAVAIVVGALVVTSTVAAQVSPLDARQPVPRDSPARRQGNAVIRGVVVDGTTGAPMRRASVSLVIEEPDREGSRVVATTADGSGQFEFTGVPAGRVQLTASRPGYFDYDNVWNGEPEEPQWQTIAEGQRIQGVRISLFRGGVIAGRVLDEFGEPAIGVEVEVLRREPGNSGGSVRTPSMSITPTTDDTGSFRVWGLAPGDYIVGARPNRFIADPRDEQPRDGYAATYYPGTPILSSARTVRVVPGRESTGVAFGLVRVPLATMRGTVLMPLDTPSRGVTVAVSLVAPERLDGFITRSARLRDDGSFEISRLAPGTYQVTSRISQQGGVEHYGTTQATVNGSDVDGVTVSMRTGAVVRGHVLDEAGQPLNIPVMVMLRGAEQGTPNARPARTFSDGSFRMEGAFGTQVIRAVEARTVPGADVPAISTVRPLQEVTPATRLLTTWWLKSVTVNGRDVTDEAIDFERGNLEAEIVMTNRASSVRGTVAWNRTTTSRRRPAVVVFIDDDTRWGRTSRRVGTAEVEEDGRFDVRGLPAGDRYLAVAVEGASRAVLARPEMLAAIRSFATPFRVDEGGVHEIALTAVPRPRQ